MFFIPRSCSGHFWVIIRVICFARPRSVCVVKQTDGKDGTEDAATFFIRVAEENRQPHGVFAKLALCSTSAPKQNNPPLVLGLLDLSAKAIAASCVGVPLERCVAPLRPCLSDALSLGTELQHMFQVEMVDALISWQCAKILQQTEHKSQPENDSSTGKQTSCGAKAWRQLKHGQTAPGKKGVAVDTLWMICRALSTDADNNNDKHDSSVLCFLGFSSAR